MSRSLQTCIINVLEVHQAIFQVNVERINKYGSEIGLRIHTLKIKCSLHQTVVQIEH